jgi:HAMP domain-containing protein
VSDFFEAAKPFLSAPFVQILVAVIALVAAVVSAFVSFLISRRSIYINSVTVERSKWIGELRANIASLSGEVRNINQRLIDNRAFDRSDEFSSSAQKIYRLSALIRLQLNPFNEIDANLLSIIDEFTDSFNSPTDFRWASQDYLLIAHAQWLLKAEWEKVKSEAAGLPRKPWLWFKSKLYMRRYRKFAGPKIPVSPRKRAS